MNKLKPDPLTGNLKCLSNLSWIWKSDFRFFFTVYYYVSQSLIKEAIEEYFISL